MAFPTSRARQYSLAPQRVALRFGVLCVELLQCVAVTDDRDDHLCDRDALRLAADAPEVHPSWVVAVHIVDNQVADVQSNMSKSRTVITTATVALTCPVGSYRPVCLLRSPCSLVVADRVDQVNGRRPLATSSATPPQRMRGRR